MTPALRKAHAARKRQLAARRREQEAAVIEWRQWIRDTRRRPDGTWPRGVKPPSSPCPPDAVWADCRAKGLI